MSRRTWIPRIVALFALLVAGCGGSNSDGFVFTGTEGRPLPIERARQVTVNQVLARTVEANIVSMVFSGVDGSGGTVYESEEIPRTASITVEIPQTVVEFRIAYQDSSGAVVGIYQQTLPAGNGPVVITDPGYVDLDAFVLSLALNPTVLNLTVGESESLTVTALLSDGTDADVTALATLSCNDDEVASLQEATLTAEGEGVAQLSCTLLNKASSASVNVSPAPPVGPVVTLEVRSESTSVNEGETLQLQAVRIVDDVETDVTDEVDWSSENDALAIVSEDGLVTAIDEGQVEISALDSGASEQTAALTVTVVDPIYPFGIISTVQGVAQGNLSSSGATISDDGRFVAFMSAATNFFPDTPADHQDIYLKDRRTGSLTICSLFSDGSYAPDGATSSNPQISGNGRFVVFRAGSDLLIGEDVNGLADVYLYDRIEDRLELISVSSAGAQLSGGSNQTYPSTISTDGRYVVFHSDANDLITSSHPADVSQVYLRDRQAGTTELISQSNAGLAGEQSSYSFDAGISDDGRYVTYTSQATNLVLGTTAGGAQTDVFLRDRNLDTTVLVTRSATSSTTAADGTSVPTWMSRDGQTILVGTYANDLVAPPVVSAGSQIYRYSVPAGSFELLTADQLGQPFSGGGFLGQLDDEQRYLVFMEEQFNGIGFDVFVVMLDLSTGELRYVSANDQGEPPNRSAEMTLYAMSADGEDIVFSSLATDLAITDVAITTAQVFAAPNPFLAD